MIKVFNMKNRFSKVSLISFITIFMSGCGGPFDGSWVVDKEVSAGDCALVINSGKNNDGDGSDFGGMLEGFTKTMCEGLVLNIAPSIIIKKNKMTLTSLEKEEIECTIDLKTNTFQCANENSENNAGSINIIDSRLVWELPPEPEKMSMKFTYNRDNE